MISFFKKVGEHQSERNEITSSQLTDTGELIKINTAYCDKFLGNTPRNLIWNNIDYILYNVVRKAIRVSTLAQGSHQATIGCINLYQFARVCQLRRCDFVAFTSVFPCLF